MLARIANVCFRRRWLVIAAWMVVLVGGTAASQQWGGDFSGSGRLEGTDSQEAYDLLEQRFAGQAGESATIVFSVEEGAIADHGDAIGDYLSGLDEFAEVTASTGPFDTEGQVSPDGRVAFAAIDLVSYEQLETAGTVDSIGSDMISLAAPLVAEGVVVDFAGGMFVEGGVPATEVLGLVAAAVILLVAFGSIVAAGLPLITAIVGVGVGLASVGLWAAIIPTDESTVTVASMMAIGVGIDYALFIITRFRELRGAGLDARQAMVGASATAGRAVVFAGLTVMVSLLGILLMQLDFLNGIAIGSASAIAVAVVAALTLLPALVSLVYQWIPPLVVDSGVGSDPAGPAPAGRHGFWFRWSRTLQHHPILAATAGLGLLLAAAAPALALQLGTADAGSDPEGTTTRRAYDTLAEGFGAGFNGPLVLVGSVEDDTTAQAGESAPGPTLAASFDAVAAALAVNDGVAHVGRPLFDPTGDAAVLTVIPTTSPQDEATVGLIETIRADLADVEGAEIHVGGATASNVDFASVIGGRLPLFIGGVLVCSFGLLLVSFRSLLVPLKAVVMNLLSIGSAYGVMVMVFQWGWLGSLVGAGTGAPIEPWVPMILFAIVFGLSMDYEVFLLSRVRERYDLTGDNSLAVADGVASTARVISAAAAIMVCVFGFFVFGDLRVIKLIGLGLATAVLIDATVVRLILVPATMELLGDRNWWLPGWLDRLLPRFEVDGHLDPEAESSLEPNVALPQPPKMRV